MSWPIPKGNIIIIVHDLWDCVTGILKPYQYFKSIVKEWRECNSYLSLHQNQEIVLV